MKVRRCSRTSGVYLLVVALGAIGCRGRLEPSREYGEARLLYAEALQASGADAPFDARAEAALQLLAQVPTESLDALAAQGLAEEIRAERLRRTPAAAPSVERGPGEEPWKGGSAADDEPTRRAEAQQLWPTAGMTEGELRTGYGSCLAVNHTRAGAGGRSGTRYSLRDSSECRSKHPELIGLVLGVTGGLVIEVEELTATRDRVRPAVPRPGTHGSTDSRATPLVREIRVDEPAVTPIAGDPPTGSDAPPPM